jgi:type IV pilus assembly protein PilB
MGLQEVVKLLPLYTVLNEINNDQINISTLEDPVEVIIQGISQISLNEKMNIGFATGLRSLLRQDPDTIMVGEIRDEETAKMGVRASLTGHKVYTTIHCKTGRDVYFRLEDMGVKGYLIRDSLVGIISQRLIRTLCSNCKKSEIIIFKGKKLLLYEVMDVKSVI